MRCHDWCASIPTGGGSFCYCPACGRLNIYGATCVCGQRTDLPIEDPS